MNDLYAHLAPVIASGQETEEVELKERLDLSDRASRAELARDIMAMANCQGGYIVVGVKDRRHRGSDDPNDYVIGWQDDPDETERTIRQTLVLYCDPPPRVSIHRLQEPATQRTLLVINVLRSHARPHATKRASGSLQEHEIWVRDGPTVRRATRTEIEEMFASQRRVILVNFSHPLSDEQKEHIRLLLNARIEEVIHVPVHFDHDACFADQAVAWVDRVGLTSHHWQTKDIVVNLPGYSPGAAVILAEIHGRMGHFPTILRIKPSHSEAVTTYEPAEAINLQSLRDAARERR